MRSDNRSLKHIGVIAWKSILCTILASYIRKIGKVNGRGSIILSRLHGGGNYNKKFGQQKIRRILDNAYRGGDSITRSILNRMGYGEVDKQRLSITIVNGIKYLARLEIEPAFTLFNVPRGSVLKTEVLLELIYPWKVNEMRYYTYGLACERDASITAIHALKYGNNRLYNTGNISRILDVLLKW